MMLYWLLIIDILLCNSQVFPSIWQDNGCIPDNEYFICTSLDSLRNLNWIRNNLSYVKIKITSTSSNLSPIHTTDSYRIDNTNIRNIDDLSICFYPDIKPITNPSIQFNVYNNNEILMGSYTIDNINAFNITPNEPPITFTEYWGNINTIFNVSAMTHIPQIRFSLWLSSLQCMEITISTMYFPNDYNLNIQMYRLNKANNEITQNTMFETSKYITYDSLQSFNSILCLSGWPIHNEESLIGANFTLTDETTSRSYSLYTINNKHSPFYTSPSEYWQQTTYDRNTLHFAIGNIEMNYWQSCSLRNESIINNGMNDIVSNTMRYTIILLTSLFIIILICICSSCYTCKSYYGTDPIHYSNILWCLLSIWDFGSQLMFAAFIILQIPQSRNDKKEVLYILLIAIGSLLLISYLCNLLYLIHYLQIWNDPSAPGVTRHWLELWSWLLIFITMTMGGVQTSLELCNCLIIPIDVFSMHLAHSELVRIRKDRFITNVLIQDIPIFIIIFIYIFLFHFENTFDIILNNYGAKYIVINNVLLSTLISIFVSTIFRFIRRNYSHDNPIAQYQFSFSFHSNEWQSYWIHSHQKIQKCFKYAFDLRKLSLTIIDQCSESLNAMKIEGRLLKDDKHKSERVEKMVLGNVTKSEMKQIGLDLLKEFTNEFLHNGGSDIRIDHLTIKPIYGGEIVYNHRTCVQILCFGFLDCLRAIGHKCCPSFINKPPNRRQSVIPIKSPKSYTQSMNNNNNNNEYELSIENISPTPKSFDFNNNTGTKTMTLTVDKSTIDMDHSHSGSNSNLPMITIEPVDNDIDESKDTNNTSQKRELSQSASTRNIMNKETLFADVYNNENNNNNNLAELNENTEEIAMNNPPNIINAAEWMQKYKQIQHDRKETDQYGYETNRKITFLSQQDIVKKHAGDAPVAFSHSTNKLLRNNNNSNHIHDHDDDDDEDEDHIDI